MSRDLDLLVLGDCNPDVLVLGDDVTPEFGQQEKLVPVMSLVVGGSASITAVAAARLGLRVALVAAVGADAAGQLMLAELGRQGVDTATIALRPDLPTGMTVALSRGADRAILTATGAMTTITADDVPAGLLDRARHVHVAGYFLVAASLGPGLAGLLGSARSAGATTSVDTNWDPSGRWQDPWLRQVIAGCDVLLPNEAEALQLSGASTLPAAAERLTRDGGTLAVKLGARGAACWQGKRMLRALPPPVTVADATGAGDCFSAGMLAGLLRGQPLAEALALGCAVGAASTRAAGGTAGCPDLAEALALASAVTVTDG